MTSDSSSLYCIGFFAEHHDDPITPLPKLKEAKKGCKIPQKDKALNYLNNHPWIILIPVGGRDILLDPPNKNHGPIRYHIRTDGLWTWPEYYSYYIDKYDIEIEPNFLQYLEKRNYKVIPESNIDFNRLDDFKGVNKSSYHSWK